MTTPDPANRPVFPDPRLLPRHSLANVVRFVSERADQYRQVADEHPLPESEYIASLFASVAGWLDIAQVEIMRGDVEGDGS